MTHQPRNRTVGRPGHPTQFAPRSNDESTRGLGGGTAVMSDDPFDEIKHLRPSPTGHFVEKMTSLGIDPDDIVETLRDPDRCYQSGPNSKYPDQWRLTGNGICITADARGRDLVLRTVFMDGEMTPPRPDQLDTEEGREYARRYAMGMGRKGTR